MYNPCIAASDGFTLQTDLGDVVDKRCCRFVVGQNNDRQRRSVLMQVRVSDGQHDGRGTGEVGF